MHGQQSGQLATVAVDEPGDDALVVVAAVEHGVDHRDGEDAAAGAAQAHAPSMIRTRAQTISNVTRAVTSEPTVKSPMKCSGMWISANGTAVRSAARRPGRGGARRRVWTSPAHAGLLPYVDQHQVDQQTDDLGGHEGNKSTGLKVSPSATASPRVTAGSPARTSSHQPDADAPLEHPSARARRPVPPSAAHVTHSDSGKQGGEHQQHRRDPFRVEPGDDRHPAVGDHPVVGQDGQAHHRIPKREGQQEEGRHRVAGGPPPRSRSGWAGSADRAVGRCGSTCAKQVGWR